MDFPRISPGIRPSCVGIGEEEAARGLQGQPRREASLGHHVEASEKCWIDRLDIYIIYSIDGTIFISIYRFRLLLVYSLYSFGFRLDRYIQVYMYTYRKTY